MWKNTKIVDLHMKRAGNCQFSLFNGWVRISIGEWSNARQAYKPFGEFFMSEDMFCAIKEPWVLLAVQEVLAGKSISLGEKVKLLRHEYKIQLKDDRYTVWIHNTASAYKEPTVSIRRRLVFPCGGLRLDALVMDLPSFYRLINIDKIEDLPLWGPVTHEDDSDSDSDSSDSGYEADDDDESAQDTE